MKTSRFLATIPRRLSCISKNKLWNQRFFVTSIKVIPFVRRVRCYPIRIVDLPFRTIWRTKDSIEYFFFFFSLSRTLRRRRWNRHIDAICSLRVPAIVSHLKSINQRQFHVWDQILIATFANFTIGVFFSLIIAILYDQIFSTADTVFRVRRTVLAFFFFLEIIPLLYEDSTVMMTWWLRGEKDWKTRCSSFFMYFIRNKSLHAFSFFFPFFFSPLPLLVTVCCNTFVLYHVNTLHLHARWTVLFLFKNILLVFKIVTKVHLHASFLSFSFKLVPTNYIQIEYLFTKD